MRIGAGLSGSLKDAPEAARLIEDRGYDFLTTGESSHNPFLPITLAAEHTSRVDLVTSIALAFARSPMDTAYIAWDLQRLSGGRFVLGLGSQVRGHVVTAVQHGLVRPRAPDARLRACHARRVGQLAERRQARL